MPTLNIAENKMEKIAKVVLVVDRINWAWGHKAKALAKHLADEFDIMIIPESDPLIKNLEYLRADIYLIFGFSQAPYVHRIPESKKIIGVTAHRDKSFLFPYLKQFNWINANSVMLMEMLKEWDPPGRLFYTPNGVDENLFAYKESVEGNEVKFGFVGNPIQSKNHLLISMIVHNLISHTKSSENATPLEQMPSVYYSFDVIVIASTKDGTPNPALEAAACGRMILSNEIGNMPEFIIDIRYNKELGNGILLDGIDLQTYKEVVKYLKEHPELVRLAGKNARRTVEASWTWKRNAENYRKMFKAILANQEG